MTSKISRGISVILRPLRMLRSMLLSSLRISIPWPMLKRYARTWRKLTRSSSSRRRPLSLLERRFWPTKIPAMTCYCTNLLRSLSISPKRATSSFYVSQTRSAMESGEKFSKLSVEILDLALIIFSCLAVNWTFRGELIF
jgi:hypothetical protein